jgi:phage FluMu protein Com
MSALGKSIVRERENDHAARPNLEEVRCVRCGRLLLKWEMVGSAHVEVKCPRCQQMNFVNLRELKEGRDSNHR